MTNPNQPFENRLCINGQEGLVAICIKRLLFENKKCALYRSTGEEEREEVAEEERKRKERREEKRKKEREKRGKEKEPLGVVADHMMFK